MDKINRYQAAVCELLTEYVNRTVTRPANQLVPQILVDKEHNKFQVLYYGWQKEKYVFFPAFHFDIIDGKIWLQCNNTEWEVDTILIEKGVAKEDIVIGFLPPYYREIAKQEVS
jgi:hypothetical protein